MMLDNKNSTVYDCVHIRTIDYLNSKDAALVGAFLSNKDKMIPIYYQYCQPEMPNDTENADLIGYATNFRVDDGRIVCDVHLNVLAMNSQQFDGTIDNYTFNINNDRSILVFTLTRLIIYNKDFKSARDDEIANSIQLVDCDEDCECEEDEYYDDLLQQ